MTKTTETSQPPRGVVEALIGDLDDDIRREYDLVTPGKPVARPRPQMPAGSDMAPPPDFGLTNLDLRDVWSIIKGTFRQMGVDRVSAVAGGVTFFGLLSLFPALTAFVSIYGLIADPATISGHLDLMERFLPRSALDLIRTQVTAITSAPGSALSVAGVVGLLAAFYSANGGVKALLSALNVAFFKSETRGFFKLNLVAMCFTLCGLVLIVVMLSVIAIIPAILSFIPMGGRNEMFVSLIRWPILFLVLVGVLAAIYRYGPAVPNYRWRWISPGAFFAAVALVITSVLFSWYAANFANYNETYGSLGAVVVLMMWLWLSAIMILIGAEINSEVERCVRRRVGAPDQEAIQLATEAIAKDEADE